VSGAFDGLPIRVRLAGVSALLTLVILCAFALLVGALAVRRVRADFDRQVTQTAEGLTSRLGIYLDSSSRVLTDPPLDRIAGVPEGSVIKLFTIAGAPIAHVPRNAPSLGTPHATLQTVGGYRVISRLAPIHVGDNGPQIGEVVLQYGRALSSVDATVARLELLLLVGVLGGSGFALLAGVMLARRAMAPIAELTRTAEEIASTRDPSRTIPLPRADDEVAELARTLQGMLRELGAAHLETEAALSRQRRFVADASHELRTPLTSILANLELLADRSGADQLPGELADAASSALRSSQRMRRLVADLLLLARGDVGRVVPHEPCDLGRIAVEAAAELGSIGASHEIILDVHPAHVLGARDELHRLTINLIENALRHTPEGTEIRVSTDTTPEGRARLVVEDDGPGVPEELTATLFERFVRGAGDRGGSFGLGLAIVRAVAESHGGAVTLEPNVPHGARFVVRLPAGETESESDLNDHRQHHRPAAKTLVD
jgi:signal transduction histidine kinase